MNDFYKEEDVYTYQTTFNHDFVDFFSVIIAYDSVTRSPFLMFEATH
jgi:hypothetical protein